MAKDIFHNNVRQALENDGWTITHDPYLLGDAKSGMEIDLGAEKIIAAEKENEKIAVEIKSFVGKSMIYDFHLAVGQHSNYFSALEEIDNFRTLFLALPERIYYSPFFQSPFIQKRLKEEGIKLLLFNPESNTIASWIK